MKPEKVKPVEKPIVQKEAELKPKKEEVKEK